MKKTEFILEVKEIDGDAFDLSLNVYGSRQRLNLYLINAMLESEDLKEIITDASEQYEMLVREQRERERNKK